MDRRGGARAGAAEGRTAVVHDLGDGRVLRRYRDPATDTRGEARLMSLAAAHGVPVPDVLGADGRDIVLARVDGPSMLEALAADPSSAAEVGRTLASLHRRLDDVRAPPGRLLHGDLHPGNVLLSSRGPVLVDWTNAGWGPGAQDVATTWLVLACFEPDATKDRATNGHASWDVVRRPLLDAFLTATERSAAAAALPVVAARRMADPATTAVERARLSAFVRRAPRRRWTPGPVEWRRGESNP